MIYNILIAAICPTPQNLDTRRFDPKTVTGHSRFMSIKMFEYKNCDTCKKAIKYLEANAVKFEKIPIVDQPPSLPELKQMLTYLKNGGESFKKLFNTSGVQYRELKVADQIKDGLTENEALKILSTNGKLIKRPFLLTSSGGTVGFKQDDWAKLLQLKE